MADLARSAIAIHDSLKVVEADRRAHWAPGRASILSPIWCGQRLQPERFVSPFLATPQLDMLTVDGQVRWPTRSRTWLCYTPRLTPLSSITSGGRSPLILELSSPATNPSTTWYGRLVGWLDRSILTGRKNSRLSNPCQLIKIPTSAASLHSERSGRSASKARRHSSLSTKSLAARSLMQGSGWELHSSSTFKISKTWNTRSTRSSGSSLGSSSARMWRLY